MMNLQGLVRKIVNQAHKLTHFKYIDQNFILYLKEWFYLKESE